MSVNFIAKVIRIISKARSASPDSGVSTSDDGANVTELVATGSSSEVVNDAAAPLALGSSEHVVRGVKSAETGSSSERANEVDRVSVVSRDESVSVIGSTAITGSSREVAGTVWPSAALVDVDNAPGSFAIAQ